MIKSLLTSMAAIIDFARNGRDALIMRNMYLVVIIILDLELETPEILPVAALAKNLALRVPPLHCLASIVQP